MGGNEIPLEPEPKMFTIKGTAHLNHDEIADALGATRRIPYMPDGPAGLAFAMRYMSGNMQAPPPSQDAPTVSYVNAQQDPTINVLPSVMLATTHNILCSGAQYIDDNFTTMGSRVLVKDQDDPSENGVYVVDHYNHWSRAFDGGIGCHRGALVFVEMGSQNVDTSWVQVNDVITPEISPVLWIQYSSGG